MKVNYEYTRKHYKNFLYRSRIISNIILFIICLGIYLYFSREVVPLIYLPLFIISLIVLIILLNVAYVHAYLKVNEMLNNTSYGKCTLELTPNKFSLTINKSKTDYKYNNIRRIIVKKNCFIVKFKNRREYLTFEKNLFTEKEYNDIIKELKNKSN